MVREELENDSQLAPSEVWGRMSADQREHVKRLLTQIACGYVETHLERGEGNRILENIDNEQ